VLALQSSLGILALTSFAHIATICWHPERSPASIIAMSCRQSFSLPSIHPVWATWINQACSSGQWTILFLKPHQKLCAALRLYLNFGLPIWATSKVWPHAQVLSKHLVVDLVCSKWQVPITLAPQFLTPMSLATTLKLFCQANV
jgi:hypothetical protein